MKSLQKIGRVTQQFHVPTGLSDELINAMYEFIRQINSGRTIEVFENVTCVDDVEFILNGGDE